MTFEQMMWHGAKIAACAVVGGAILDRAHSEERRSRGEEAWWFSYLWCALVVLSWNG